jgi:hypothetical protein
MTLHEYKTVKESKIFGLQNYWISQYLLIIIRIYFVATRCLHYSSGTVINTCNPVKYIVVLLKVIISVL